MEQASAALGAALASGPAGWVDFDRSVRRREMHSSRDMTPPEAGAPLARMALELAFALASRSGYRRAEALGHPDLSAYPQVHPLVLVRAVDPVEPVRHLALKLLPSVLAAADRAALPTMASVAFRLRNRQHAGPMAEAVSTAIGELSDEDLLTVLAGLGSRAGDWMGASLIARGRLTADLLAAVALGKYSDRLQERCARALADQVLPEKQTEALRMLSGARASRVLVIAIEGLVELGEFEGIEDFLSHRSAAVRGVAQWGLTRAGDDPAARYRTRLRSVPASPKGSIAGLGECGAASDAELISRFLHDHRSKTRAAAVHALKNLRVDADLARLLTDPAPVVVRAVSVYLAERRALPPVADLRELVNGDEPEHVRGAAAALLRHHGIWQRVWADLSLLADPDARLAENARSDLDNLCRIDLASTAAPIGEPLRIELQALLGANRNRIQERHHESLTWALRNARLRSAR